MAQEHTIIAGKSDELIPGKLTQEGKRVYQERLKAILEPEHVGRFVAIEPNSGRYFLGDSGAEALIAARDAMPEGGIIRFRTWKKRETLILRVEDTGTEKYATAYKLLDNWIKQNLSIYKVSITLPICLLHM